MLTSLPALPQPIRTVEADRCWARPLALLVGGLVSCAVWAAPAQSEPAVWSSAQTVAPLGLTDLNALALPPRLNLPAPALLAPTLNASGAPTQPQAATSASAGGPSPTNPSVIADLADGATGLLRKGANGLAQGAQVLVGGAASVAGGAGQLAVGVANGAGGLVGHVVGGAGQLVGGAGQLVGGVLGDAVGVVQGASDQLLGGANLLIANAFGLLGVPYRRGGSSEATGFDCSGFVQTVYERTLGLVLPRSAAQQAAATQKIDFQDLKPGDLVFFNTMRRAFSHVGIYVGDGQFVHSPRAGAQVRVERMDIAYWKKRFNGARRVIGLDTAEQPAN